MNNITRTLYVFALGFAVTALWVGFIQVDDCGSFLRREELSSCGDAMLAPYEVTVVASIVLTLTCLLAAWLTYEPPSPDADVEDEGA